MRLGMMIGYSGSQLLIDMDLIKEAEKLGYDSVWSAEAYGSDAATPLAYIAAQTSKIKLGTGIMQLPGRTPANTAMTAMTIDALSNGRFILGLGTSGPQVVEGWHGVPFDKPLEWMKEYVEIVRAILAREKPLEYSGQRYQIPYRGPGATGLGKPLKSILYGRKNMPIYIGAMAPKSQTQTAEIADGLLLTCMDPERFEVIEENLTPGFAKAGNGKTLANFDVAPTVAVIMGDDLDACRMPLKMSLALYIGGMGAKSKNFYNAYIRRIGYEKEAEEIQNLYL
ncbi:MAG: LLM class F420-dependent oxidoreductase, partial [Polyangiaceae bacterium]